MRNTRNRAMASYKKRRFMPFLCLGRLPCWQGEGCEAALRCGAVASIAARASVLSREKRALLKSMDFKRYIISKSLRDKATCTKLHCGIAPRGFALPHPAPDQCDPVHKPQCLPACLHRGQGKRAERTHLLKKGRTLQQCKL